ncbi:MAG: tol-pal system protein YbgF [Deltaproteobacteria bacterium]|nr:tol-pal system protein YbgF [Deltaproteobacteria bacterium]
MKSFFLFFVIFFIFISGFSLSGCALREDVYILDNRLASLERRYSDFESKNQSFFKNIKSYTENSSKEDNLLREQSASLNAEIDKLRDEIRLLYGRVEETEHLLNSRIMALEESNNRGKRALVPVPGNVYSKKETYRKVVKEQTPDNRIYQKAKEAFDSGDNKAAIEGFTSLLKQYPNSRNADNAQFWFGEVYYRKKSFKKAILEYQKVIEKYPDGNKVKSALLKQGFAFFNLEDTANARLIFKKLIRKYPESSEAKIAAHKLRSVEKNNRSK